MVFMEYIVKVNDKEYGPVSDDILVRWVEDGRVLPESEVRNSKLNLWKRADSFSFLKDAFNIQESKFRKNQQTLSQKPEHNLTRIIQISHQEQQKKISTDFKNSYLPQKAGTYIRLKAGLIDLIAVICLFIISIYAADHLMKLFSSNSSSSAALCAVIITIFLVLLYFGSTLGVFAQTIGMWYYGLILVREGDEADEVYLMRAFIFSVFLCVFWFISPVFNYIFGSRRSLHDYMTDTQVVLISARKN